MHWETKITKQSFGGVFLGLSDADSEYKFL